MQSSARNTPARMFLCARCRAQVVICSHCDRGQRYCSPECARVVRQSSMRAAGRRYQQCRQGRHNHAQRMARCRLRRRHAQAEQAAVTVRVSPAAACNAPLPGSAGIAPAAQIVTHQGSPVADAAALLAGTPLQALTPAVPGGGALGCCHFCGGRCSAFVRHGFLRGRRTAARPLLPAHGGSPHDDFP